MIHSPYPSHRAAFVDDLRELAELLSESFTIPVPTYPRIDVPLPSSDFAASIDHVRVCATAAGVELRSDDDGARATITIGRLRYEVFVCSPQAMARYHAAADFSQAVRP